MIPFELVHKFIELTSIYVLQPMSSRCLSNFDDQPRLQNKQVAKREIPHETIEHSAYFSTRFLLKEKKPENCRNMDWN